MILSRIFFFNFRHIKNSTEIKNKKIKTNEQTNKKLKQETYEIRLEMYKSLIWIHMTIEFYYVKILLHLMTDHKSRFLSFFSFSFFFKNALFFIQVFKIR